MRLLDHLPLKRESGGEWGSLPGAVPLRLKPPLGIQSRVRAQLIEEDLLYPVTGTLFQISI